MPVKFIHVVTRSGTLFILIILLYLLCECNTIQLLMIIWIVCSLGLLCKTLLEKLLYMSSEEYIYTFLFCIYLGMEFLSPWVHIWSAPVDIASFPKCLNQFILLLLIRILVALHPYQHLTLLVFFILAIMFGVCVILICISMKIMKSSSFHVLIGHLEIFYEVHVQTF